MALVKGTNCGFVATAPTADPNASATGTQDGYQVGAKFTSPSGNNKITEIGWYQASSSNSAGAYNVGIYSHDAGNNRPNALIATQSTGQSTTANTPGWYKYTGLNIPIDPDTIYWIAVGQANVTGANTVDRETNAAEQRDYKTVGSAPNYLTTPWGTSSGAGGYLNAYYAKYEPTSQNVNVDTALARSAAVARAGSAVAGAALSLTKSASYASGGPAAAAGILALPKSILLSSDSQKIINVILTFARQSGQSATAVAQALAAAPVSKLIGMLTAAQAASIAQSLLARYATASASAAAASQSSAQLSLYLALLCPGTIAAAGQNLSVGKSLGASTTGGAQAEGLIALAKIIMQSAAAASVIDCLTTLSRQADITTTRLAQTIATATLARLLGVTSEAITENEYLVDCLLDRNASIGAEANATAQASAQMLIAQSLLSLALAQATGTISIDNLRTVATDGIGNAFAETSVGLLKSVFPDGGLLLQAALELALSQGVSASCSALIEGIITLHRSAASTAEASADSLAAVDLSGSLAIILLANAIAESGLSLACIKGIVVVGQEILFIVETPDDRIITICADNRLIEIIEDDRDIVVNPDNRLTEINEDDRTIDIDPDNRTIL